MAKTPKETHGEAVESAAAAVGHLHEAKERLKDAASAAGHAVRNAAATAVSAARDDLSASREAVTDPLHDVAEAGRAAASEAKAAAAAEVEALVGKGKDLWHSAEDVIRKHPMAAFGTALATGWVLAKLIRRRD